MFFTEVDASKKKAVHDELARLLVQYLRQHGSTPQIKQLLDVNSKVIDVSSSVVTAFMLSCFSLLSLSLSLSLSVALVVLSRGDFKEHGTVLVHY